MDNKNLNFYIENIYKPIKLKTHTIIPEFRKN